MTQTETILLPRILLMPEGIFAIQGDIYTVDYVGRVVQQHYPVTGLPKFASAHGVSYLNVTNKFRSTVQAVRATDGALLREYLVDDPLAGAPAIGDGVLIVASFMANCFDTSKSTTGIFSCV